MINNRESEKLMFQWKKTFLLTFPLRTLFWSFLLILLIYLSIQPSSRLTPPFVFVHSDKLYHGLYYGILVCLSKGFLKYAWEWIVLALFLVILGVLLEFAQQAVPGRFFSYGDIMANISGVFLGLVFLYWIRMKKQCKG